MQTFLIVTVPQFVFSPSLGIPDQQVYHLSESSRVLQPFQDHTYTSQPAGPGKQNSISGHLFARNLEGPWHVSPDEPYDNIVQYADKLGQIRSSQTFSTMERPKLMFDAEGNPTQITNGVSPVYPCDSCKGFGDAPKEGGCCWCKVTPGEDWTYTLMQPIGGTS